ncbi:MAG: MBL fold metallo-hydrolase [Actinomycetales bacterium]
MNTQENTTSRRAVLLGAAGVSALGAAVAATPATAAETAQGRSRGRGGGEMTVTLLGTGSPVPSATRMGPSTLVQANGVNLLFDAGRGAAVRLVQAGIGSNQIDATFITHYHSDHVNGLSDVWMMGYIPALGARTAPFQLYGPRYDTLGVQRLADGLMHAHQGDIDARVADAEVNPAVTPIEAHDFTEDGIVFERSGVKVRMFTVEHDPRNVIRPAVGYRVDYGGRSVLMSGDTRPTPNVLTFGKNVDLLIHEVADFPDPTLPIIQNVYAHHTSPQQAGEIFSETKPAMAVYSHIVRGVPPKIPNVGLDTIVARTRENYDGPLLVGEDLTRFVLTRKGISVTPHYAEND